MVNNNPYLKILSNLQPPPDNNSTDRSDRSIGNSPLWKLSDIVGIGLLHKESRPTIRMVTSDADKEYASLLENGFDLKETLVKLVSAGRFKGAFWCKTSAKDANGKPRGSGSWIPCDAYVITLPYEHPVSGYKGVCEYYLKMCKGVDGTTVLFVSLHV
jgi:hypothetical protein